MRRCVQAKVSVTTHSPASRGLQKGDFLQARYLQTGRFPGSMLAEPRTGSSMLETNARVLNGQKHRLSWDVAAAKDAKATVTLVYFDCFLLVSVCSAASPSL